MKVQNACAMVTTALLAAGFSLYGQIQPVGDAGNVDWGKRTITAKGIGAPNPDMPEATRRPAAIRAARVLALRSALEVAKGVQINSETTIENLMVSNDAVNTSISGFLKGFQFEANPHYMSDGSVEISVTIPLDGVDGLGGALYGKGDSIVRDKPAITAMPEGTAGSTAQVFTGLIIDATGLGIKPAMAPKVLDEAGNEVYGSAYVSRAFAVKYGMAGYAKSVDDAVKNKDRIGKTPGKVKAIKASGANKCDVVLSAEDAASVRSSAKNLKFLQECRVIIVVD
jgi:hypothetical protein